MSIIPAFTGIHEFLSNGHEGDPFDLQVGDNFLGYPTAEHAFQALKATTWEQHEWVRSAARPFGADGAKRRGRAVTLWPDWEERKFDVMRFVLEHKFAAGTPLALRLLATEHTELIEGNDWGDTCWGVSGGVGRNWLGTLLMARRAVLRSQL